MSKLFILGTGFSKAVSCKMPTMEEMSEYFESKIRCLPDGNRIYEIYKRLSPDSKKLDIERLLTYLFQVMPWKSTEEVYRDKAVFLNLSNLIADYIIDCEEEAFKNTSKPWTTQFVDYLDISRSTVATFNYDTVLERLSQNLERPIFISNNDGLKRVHRKEKISSFSIYSAPIVPLRIRIASSGSFLGGGIGPDYAETYKLLKLHGSINWYFPGDENIFGQSVYGTDISGLSPKNERNNEEVRRSKKDLIPLIIPPVAEKSLLYGTKFVGLQWHEFRHAIENAEEIYCVGYSLPKTDFTTGLFFSTAMNTKNKRVYIINLKKNSDELIQNYKQAMPECELITDYISDCDPIEGMVKALMKSLK